MPTRSSFISIATGRTAKAHAVATMVASAEGAEAFSHTPPSQGTISVTCRDIECVRNVRWRVRYVSHTGAGLLVASAGSSFIDVRWDRCSMGSMLDGIDAR